MLKAILTTAAVVLFAFTMHYLFNGKIPPSSAQYSFDYRSPDPDNNVNAIITGVPGEVYDLPNGQVEYTATGLVRFDQGFVTVSPDNDLISGDDAGKIVAASCVCVSGCYGAAYPSLVELFPNRDWVVRAWVHSTMQRAADGTQTVVEMTIEPLGVPFEAPVFEG